MITNTRCLRSLKVIDQQKNFGIGEIFLVHNYSQQCTIFSTMQLTFAILAAMMVTCSVVETVILFAFACISEFTLHGIWPTTN